jgi:hypothetical protein
VEKEVRKELMLDFQHLVLAVGVCKRQLGGNEMPIRKKARLDRP